VFCNAFNSFNSCYCADKSSKRLLKDIFPSKRATSEASELEQELASMQGTSDNDDASVLKRKTRPSSVLVSPKESKGKLPLRRRNVDAEASLNKPSAAFVSQDKEKAAEKGSVT